MIRNSIDFLALPHVAIKKSLSTMPPTDVLSISRTSEHSRDIIKTINFNVILRTYGSDVDVYWGDWCSGKFKIGKGKEEAEWRDAVTEITSLFRTSLDTLQLETNDFNKTWEWIKKEQTGLNSLRLTVKNGKDPREIIRALLDNSELTELEELNFELKTTPTYKFKDSFVLKNPPKELWIKNASWFTVQNLMDSKAETCYLSGPKFTNKDINMILKEWMIDDGRLSNLKSIEILSCNTTISDNIAFKGFEIERGLVTINGSDLKLTCDKEFYFDVSNSVRRFIIHKKLFADDLRRSRRIRQIRRIRRF